MGVAANDTKQNTSHKANQSSSDAPRVVYKSHPETDPTSETRTLANVYAFVLESYEQKRIAAESAADTSTIGVERLNEPGKAYPSGEGSA